MAADDRPLAGSGKIRDVAELPCRIADLALASQKLIQKVELAGHQCLARAVRHLEGSGIVAIADRAFDEINGYVELRIALDRGGQLLERFARQADAGGPPRWAIAEKNLRERFRDARFNPESNQRLRGMLARRSAAKISAGHQD